MLNTGIQTARIRQVSSLYVSMVAGLAISFFTSIINTRTLGPQAYGDFKFVNNLFSFFATIATLGLFTTGSQVLAQLRSEDHRRGHSVGALLTFAGIISAAFILISIGFSAIEPKLFSNDLGLIILMFSPTVAVYIFQPCLENIYQGENKIHELSLFKLLPALVFLLFLMAANILGKLSVVSTLLLQLIAFVATSLVFLVRLHPNYSQSREYRKTIWEANKNYGWHVYIGILSNVATAYLSTFMISYFLDNRNVGFFSLALALTMPLTQISAVVGTTYFKDFAHADALPRKVTLATGVIAVFSMLLFLLVVKPLVLAVYTSDFAEVISLSSVIAFGATAHGVGDYFNRFLGAHGRGKELRNAAIAVGSVNVAGYIALVGLVGVQGAAVTKLVSGTAYCGLMMNYYRRYQKSRKHLNA